MRSKSWMPKTANSKKKEKKEKEKEKKKKEKKKISASYLVWRKAVDHSDPNYSLSKSDHTQFRYLA